MSTTTTAATTATAATTQTPTRPTAGAHLAHARYGKDKIRVFRVVREGAWHHVVEYNVSALLEGGVDVSYTQADNSVIVATDSIKNITYYLAKTSPHVLHAERFALHLGAHLVSTYAHVRKALVSVEKLRWRRIRVPGLGGLAGQEGAGTGAGGEKGEGEKGEGEHPHAFYRDGEDRRVVQVEIDGTAGKDGLVAKVTSGIKDLLVLKTTGSAFESFIRDAYTTLKPVPDRILATAVDVSYVFEPFGVPRTSGFEEGRGGAEWRVEGEEAGEGSAWDGERVAEGVRGVTLEVFAVDESASVQATLYKMGERIVGENGRVMSVEYELPNVHYVPVDMGYIGVENLEPAKAEVFVPLGAPSGLICGRISRDVI